jgi:hypothetical protein
VGEDDPWIVKASGSGSSGMFLPNLVVTTEGDSFLSPVRENRQ